MQVERSAPFVGAMVKIIDATAIERGGAALNAVDNVTLGQQKFREVSAILPRHAGNERTFFFEGGGHHCTI